MKEEPQVTSEELEKIMKIGLNIAEGINNEDIPKINLSDDTSCDFRKSQSSERIRQVRRQLEEKNTEIEELILTCLGQLYNGVLVGGTLSCRGGKLYPYLRQYYFQSAIDVKKILLNHMREVEMKLKDKMHYVEYLLELIPDEIQENSSWEVKGEKYIYMPITPFYLPTHKDLKTFEKVAYLRLDTIYGEFCLVGSVGGRYLHVPENLFYVLFTKLDKEVTSMYQQVTGYYEERIEASNKEIAEIKDKCSRLLAMAVLKERLEQNDE